MRIKSNLVYSQSTGRFVGYTEMVSINDKLRTFQGIVGSKTFRQQHRKRVCQLCFGLDG